jgi:hypothetical protein
VSRLDQAIERTVDEAVAEEDRPCFLIHLSEAQARDLVRGIVPPDLAKDCEDFLIFADEGMQAGLRRMRENARTSEARAERLKHRRGKR